MPLPISDEEKKRIYAFSGVDPNKFDIVDSGDQYEYVLKNAPTIQPPEPATSVTDLAGANLPKPPGGLESTARAAASSVLPTAGGLLATAGVMAALPEPFVSKIGALGALGLAGVAGLAGSYGASKLQDEVVPDSVKQALFSRPEDLAAHPYLSAAGGFVPSALAFKPNLGDLKTLASGVRNLSPLVQGAEGALTQAERAALLNATANIAPAAGMEAYEVGTGQKEFDPISSALNIVPGALFTRPTALGQKLGFPNVQDAQPIQTTPEIQPTTQEPAVPKAKPATTEGVQSGFNKEGVVVTSSGEVLPAGATKLNKPDLTGEVRGKNPYEAMSGNTDDTIIGEQRPTKSAAASAEVLKQAPIEAQKAVDYETAIRERAKQDAEEVYKKAYEEAAQAKLVNTDVARPEIKPKPIATTELEKEIFPDYTGVQEADTTANITQPKTEAEWIQEQFDRQERYQPADDTNKQADKDTQFIKNFEQEVQRRGMKVKYVDSLVGADGKQKRGSYDPKTRTVTISKSKNLVDTYSHEVGHGYVEDLLKTGRPGDERQVLNGLEFADEKGRKFKTRAEWDALSPEEKLSIEERFVQQLGEEGAKLRKTELYGSKREKFSQWFENVGSNLKYKLGMGEGKDVSRKTAVGQKFDQPEYTRMGVDEIKAAAPKFQDTEEDRDTFELSIQKELKSSSPFNMAPDKDGKLVGSYLADRLPKVLPKLEYDMLKEAGIEKFLRYNKRTPAEISEWIKESGPKVKVESYGMEGKVSEAKRELDKMRHEWYDALNDQDKWVYRKVNEGAHRSAEPDSNAVKIWKNDGWSDKNIEQGLKLRRLKQVVANEPADTSPRATSAYDTVSAFSTKEPMPEWTKTRSGKNVQRVDVVVPQRDLPLKRKLTLGDIPDGATPAEIAKWRERGLAGEEVQYGTEKEAALWQPDNLHENLPNTLGWAMIQYKDGPKGEKVAVVVEAQSRWGQSNRNVEQQIRNYDNSVTAERISDPDIPGQGAWQIKWKRAQGDLGAKQVYGVETAKEAIAQERARYEKMLRREIQDHPLLRDYNRLILKAAIDQARKEGATHIVVSDAESAMMTEGHDLQSSHMTKMSLEQVLGAYRYDLERDKNNTIMKDYYGDDWKQGKYMKHGELSYPVRVDKPEANTIKEYSQYAREMQPYYEQGRRWVAQEPGMRLNYDTILPKIAEELTGSKGERVSVGEHKNAVTPDTDSRMAYSEEAIRELPKRPRENLIFRNPDGTPKTDVSGYIYPLNEVGAKLSKEPFSLTGRKYQAVDPEDPNAKPYILPSRFDKVSKLGKTGEEISSKLQQYNSESDRLQGQVGNKIIAAMKGYDENEIMRVSQYRHAKSVYEPTPFELTSNEKKLKASLDEVYKGVGEEVIKSGMKIKEGDDFREMQLKGEGYQPSVIAQKVIHAWQERTPDAPKYDKVYTDFMEKKGLTPEEAKSTLQEYKEAVGNAGLTPDVKFNAIRKAEGKGLPWELVEQNPAVAARRYGRRVGNDMAFFKYLQNDPRMLKALGLKDQQGRKAEVLAEELGTKIDDVEWLGNSEEVKSALRSVYGIDTPVNQRGNAFIRAVSNSVMETGTALRNIVGLPTSIAGYYGVTPKTVLEAIVKTPERAARAFENNAVRSSFADQDAAGVVEGSPDKFVKLMDNYSRFMRKWTGRDFSDKFEGEFTYSLGETLAHQWFASAKTGDIKARRMLNRFGNTVDDLKGKFQPKGEITATDISKVAKNFVDATRGSYSAGGLPSSAIEGGAAPMLSLARWSIEKFNTFQKDIVRPITEHNDWMPLVKTAFAGLLTGEAVENLNELLSGKRGADPTKEEVFASGSAEDYTYKVIALLQMGGFAGMLSEAAKAGMATYQGKELKFNNPVSMPALTLAETTFQNIADAVEASKQGEDKLQVMGELMKELVKTTYQNYRYVDNRLLNPEEAKRKEKFRDIRVYKELSGEPPQKSGDQNKFLGMKERAFKRANTPEEVASSLPEAAASVVKKSEGNYEKLKSGIENLKRNSYQTFPSLSENPQKAIDYYNHLVKTLGRKEADDRFADYLKQNTLNKQKNKVLPTLK